MGKANSKGEAQAGALAFLDKLQAAAARWTPFSQADRSEETARFLRPAEHDPLIDWIEATDNSPRLVALVDEVLPGEVARRSCCAHPEKRVAWRDPIAGLQEEPGSLAPPWTWAGGDRYQEHRDDLLAIVAEVRRLIEAGALFCRDTDLPTVPAEAPLDARVSFEEALAGVPSYGLKPIPKRTLQRWMKERAGELGVNRNSDPSAQRPLVRGLLTLQANPRRKTTPPQRKGATK